MLGLARHCHHLRGSVSSLSSSKQRASQSLMGHCMVAATSGSALGLCSMNRVTSLLPCAHLQRGHQALDVVLPGTKQRCQAAVLQSHVHM